MDIIVEFEVFSGLDYYIRYEYWIDGKLWVDQKNFAILWKKRGTHFKKVHNEW